MLVSFFQVILVKQRSLIFISVWANERRLKANEKLMFRGYDAFVLF